MARFWSILDELTGTMFALNINEANMQDQAITSERQHQHLIKVSRTFALTIPLLPKEIADQISNAYLLCRIADTVEDDPKAPVDKKRAWLKEFADFASGGFADEMQLMSLSSKAVELVEKGAKESELALIKEMIPVLKRTLSYPQPVRRILSRGVAILCYGMAKSLNGVTIATVQDVDEYCYFVAGVVGELLACIFARADSNIDKEVLLKLSVSFGEGLQLTNILKDRLEDAKRGVSFLPDDAQSSEGMAKYLALTKGHLDDALDFILHIPVTQCGIRKFCLLNICMAVATLRLMQDSSFSKKKITRRKVKLLYLLTSLCAGNNFFTKVLYRIAGCGLKSQREDPEKLRERVSKWDKDTFDILIED